MAEANTDVQESSNPEGEAAVTPEETATEEGTADELAKANELAANYKIRAEKAEKARKDAEAALEKAGKNSEPSKENTLSPMDAVLLAKADVDLDDIDEVVNFAKFKKIYIADALKDRTVLNILSVKAEERKTAAATHTKGGARGSSKVSGEDLLRKAEKTGEVDIDRVDDLVEARIARKRAKLAK